MKQIEMSIDVPNPVKGAPFLLNYCTDGIPTEENFDLSCYVKEIDENVISFWVNNGGWAGELIGDNMRILHDIRIYKGCRTVWLNKPKIKNLVLDDWDDWDDDIAF